MTPSNAAVGLVLLPLLLTGCAATSGPAPTATVTVTVSPAPSAPTLQAGDAAPWDLHADCASEAGIATLLQWRDHQVQARRLGSREAAAVTQAVAVQYLEMHEFSEASAVHEQVDALAVASGTLDDPEIDLSSTAVRTARTGIARACRDGGLAIGVYAQGG